MSSPARCTDVLLGVAARCDTITRWGGYVTRRARFSAWYISAAHAICYYFVRGYPSVPFTTTQPRQSAPRPDVDASQHRREPVAAQEPSLCSELAPSPGRTQRDDRDALRCAAATGMAAPFRTVTPNSISSRWSR